MRPRELKHSLNRLSRDQGLLMTSNHSIHALMVGMSENWWRAGIMPCIRSDLERDKPVAYIFWLVEGPQGPVAVDTGIILITSPQNGLKEKILLNRRPSGAAWG
jgi:hypothetical protein